MDLSKLGIITFLDALNGKEAGQFARKVEQWGYSVLWVPDAMGREVFSLSASLLSQTERLVVGPGVVIVYAYEPIAIANASRTLGELFADRFILGLGVSNRGANDRRGIAYEKPVSFVREYLAKMKAAPYNAPTPQQQPPIVLSGMMPKMLQLAATETQGTLTYFTTTEQVARIRQTLGPNPWLCAIQAVLLETEATKARALARRYMQTYLAIDHYVQRLRSLGYGDADLANGGSDRLVDAIVAWGSEDQLRERIADQFKVGATHVSILPLNPRGEARPDERVIAALAPR
ncbi:MAG: TIGR03620 family F420-dependent LLM class oxidoreductase [Deltaproteobacteria bacterium]|nr:TIGR03620 family F420-dependent LLM class oxidoreductase [Deltaproteobacteria bacterium]